MNDKELVNTDFTEVAQLISIAKSNALKAVNTHLIELYWKVGEYISRKIEQAAWGDGVRLDRLINLPGKLFNLDN